MKRVIPVLAAILVGGAGARDSNGIGYYCWSSFTGGTIGAHIGTDGSVSLWQTRVASQGVDYTPLPDLRADYPRLAAMLDECALRATLFRAGRHIDLRTLAPDERLLARRQVATFLRHAV
jgi:hypothetical protein